jgi:raffinose/stachyose/melibiose transport system permease protein
MATSRTILRHAYPLAFLLPAVTVFGVMFLLPTVTSFWYSLTDWNIHADSVKFLGLENFLELFSDKKLAAATWHTLVFSVSATVLRNLLGLAIALMLHERIAGRNVLRTVFFLPYVIAPIIIGYLFTAILTPKTGTLNIFLRAAGLGAIAVDWLNDPRYALFSVIMVDVWRTTGFAMVIYLAGLQAIPRELGESAAIDGAGYLRRQRHITFPLLAASFNVNFILSLIGTMKVFVMVLVLTNGGPGYATEVFNTYVYGAFSLGRYGYATASNLLLFLFIGAIGIPLLRYLRGREVEL